MALKAAEQVVIITGANSGIGYHLAENLLLQGSKVAIFDLCDSNIPTLQALSENIQYFQVDVTNQDQVKHAIAKVVSSWGSINMLINNACIAHFSPYDEMDIANVKREFEVNYFGYLNLIHVVKPIMQKQGSGTIFNVSSAVGLTGFPRLIGYSSTKGAIEAMTNALAFELEKDNIQVKIIHPPLTKTPSASPLGVPEQVMANPAKVGKQLAKKIMRKGYVITPDIQTTIYLICARIFPRGLGRLMGKLTVKARKDSEMQLKL